MITKLCGKEDLRETSIPTCRKVEMTLSRYTEDLDLADIFLLLAVKLPSILSAETLLMKLIRPVHDLLSLSSFQSFFASNNSNLYSKFN